MKTLEQKELAELDNRTDEEKIAEHMAFIEAEIRALDELGVHITITRHKKVTSRLISILMDKVIADNLEGGIDPSEETENKKRLKLIKQQ